VTGRARKSFLINRLRSDLAAPSDTGPSHGRDTGSRDRAGTWHPELRGATNSHACRLAPLVDLLFARPPRRQGNRLPPPPHESLEIDLIGSHGHDHDVAVLP
jgi:hypothetical protein